MSLIERHKKPGGFRKLINMLELTVPDRRAKILDTLKKEDEAFVNEVQTHIFEFEEFKNMNGMIICDILYAMRDDMRSVAIALYKCKDEELLKNFEKNMLPKQASAFKEEMKTLSQITVGQQRGARFKVIEAARALEKSGTIVLKKYSPNYADAD